MKKMFLFSNQNEKNATIIVAQNKKEALKMLQEYNPTMSYVGIINKKLLDNLQYYNQQVLNNAWKGDEIEEKIEYYLYNGYTTQQICSIKNIHNSSSEQEENKYIYTGKDDEGHHTCYFTGSWKCSAHENRANVWFYLPEEA